MLKHFAMAVAAVLVTGSAAVEAATLTQTVRISFTASDFTPGPEDTAYFTRLGLLPEPPPAAVSGWFEFDISLDRDLDRASARLRAMQALMLSGQDYSDQDGFAWADPFGTPNSTDPFSLVVGMLPDRYGVPDVPHMLFTVLFDPVAMAIGPAGFYYDNHAGSLGGDFDPFFARSVSASMTVLATPLPASLLLLLAALALPVALRRGRA